MPPIRQRFCSCDQSAFYGRSPLTFMIARLAPEHESGASDDDGQFARHGIAGNTGQHWVFFDLITNLKVYFGDLEIADFRPDHGFLPRCCDWPAVPAASPAVPTSPG